MLLQTFTTSFCSLVLCLSVVAKDKGEFCFSTVECSDAGLFCTGARCQCIVDIDPDHGRFWGCNRTEDCATANTAVQQALSSDIVNKAEPPFCTISQQCSALPGYSGYCFFYVIP